MIAEVQRLLDDYRAWLKDKTQLRQVGGWVEITTPYLDRHNDYVQIYAARENGSFTLTDDGYTINDLEQSGCSLATPKRQELLKMTLNGFGVAIENDRLEVHASRDNFALRKHNLVQAILAVNDLFYLAHPTVSSLFYEDVEAWLELHAIRYTPRVILKGRTGYDHLFDFVIPKSRVQPERVLKTINRPNRDAATAVAFAWIDTKESRMSGSKAYAVLNDADFRPSAGVLEALQSYDVKTVMWSERERVVEELAA